MWISLFFLQAILVLVLGDEDCIHDLLKCDSYRVPFFERVYSRYLVKRPAQLKRKCRALEPFLDCLEDATFNCHRVGLSDTEAGFVETRQLVKQLCLGRDEELKERFLKSADCINDHIVEMEEQCDTAELRSMISQLVPARNFSCEYQRALLNCKALFIRRECGADASSLFKRTMNLELNMDYVCMDKTNIKEPGGLLSDIINGLVIFLVDIFKPFIRLPKDVKETNYHPTSPPILHQPSSLKNRVIKEMSLNSLIEDEMIAVEGVPHEKRPNGKSEKYENDLRRIGNIWVNRKEKSKIEEKRESKKAWYGDLLVTSQFYSLILLQSLLPNHRLCDYMGCDKSGNIFSEPVSSDKYFAVLKDPEADNVNKMEFKNENRFVVDEDGETSHESRMKINHIVVGEPYLPLEINYSDGDKDYTQVADIKISNQKYRLTPSTETVPSINSEDIKQSTVLMSGATKTEECVKEKHNLYLADKKNEDIPEESTCELKSNENPLDIQLPTFNRKDDPPRGKVSDFSPLNEATMSE